MFPTPVKSLEGSTTRQYNICVSDRVKNCELKEEQEGDLLHVNNPMFATPVKVLEVSTPQAI